MSLPLSLMPALSSPSLLAPLVHAALSEWPFADEVRVAAIDPAVSDTAAFCERYGVAPEESANCVVIAGRRGGETSYAACMVESKRQTDDSMHVISQFRSSARHDARGDARARGW